MRRRLALPLLFAGISSANGCTSTELSSRSRLGRHVAADPWVGALERNVTEPQEWVPEALFLAATPFLHSQDHDYLKRYEAQHPITGGHTIAGDSVMGALTVATAAVAGFKWYDGDHAESLEVAIESLALTSLETEVIKRGVGRRRPDAGRPNSFPSGHASYAFAASTFLARTIWDEGPDDVWTTALGAACYLPAVFVGLNRVETGRHFPSDVAFGAFVGTLTTNLIWDAHYGNAKRHREGIFERGTPSRVSLAPLLLPDGAGLVLQFSF